MRKLLVLVLITLFLTACSTETTYETISLDEIEGKVEDGYIVLDVREIHEFNEGHIPGAVNKPLSILQKGDFSQLSKDEKYIIICRSGNRSITASDILSEEGYEVVNTSAGMSTWPGEIEK